MGIVPVKKSLVQCDKLATAAFCRRRLAVVMVRLKMAETLREAVTFIEQVGCWPLASGPRAPSP
jgi:U3 small nucleolar ribonucleoprotein protein IMP3